MSSGEAENCRVYLFGRFLPGVSLFSFLPPELFCPTFDSGFQAAIRETRGRW